MDEREIATSGCSVELIPRALASRAVSVCWGKEVLGGRVLEEDFLADGGVLVEAVEDEGEVWPEVAWGDGFAGVAWEFEDVGKGLDCFRDDI